MVISPIQIMMLIAAALFSIGLMVVIIKRNTIMILLGIELMLNAANVNLVAFNRLHPNNIDGQMFALFVIIVAVCEAAIGLAIILRVYHEHKTSVPDNVNELSG